MKKEITVRSIQKEDVNQFNEWMKQSALTNHIDPSIMKYPNLVVWAAVNGKTVAFMPVQTVAMLESVAPNPEASDIEKAEALRQLVKHTISTAWGSGIRELYFVGFDKRVNRIAKRHGFEEVKGKVFRLKLE